MVLRRCLELATLYFCLRGCGDTRCLFAVHWVNPPEVTRFVSCCTAFRVRSLTDIQRLFNACSVGRQGSVRMAVHQRRGGRPPPPRPK